MQEPLYVVALFHSNVERAALRAKVADSLMCVCVLVCEQYIKVIALERNVFCTVETDKTLRSVGHKRKSCVFVMYSIKRTGSGISICWHCVFVWPPFSLSSPQGVNFSNNKCS